MQDAHSVVLLAMIVSNAGTIRIHADATAQLTAKICGATPTVTAVYREMKKTVPRAVKTANLAQIAGVTTTMSSATNWALQPAQTAKN